MAFSCYQCDLDLNWWPWDKRLFILLPISWAIKSLICRVKSVFRWYFFSITSSFVTNDVWFWVLQAIIVHNSTLVIPIISDLSAVLPDTCRHRENRLVIECIQFYINELIKSHKNTKLNSASAKLVCFSINWNTKFCFDAEIIFTAKCYMGLANVWKIKDKWIRICNANITVKEVYCTPPFSSWRLFPEDNMEKIKLKTQCTQEC